MPRGRTSFLIGIFLSAFVLWLVPRQNLEAHLKSTRCKRGCVTCYLCPAGAVMGQDEVFGRHKWGLDCVSNASLVSGTCSKRLDNFEGFSQQVPGESACLIRRAVSM